jgi:predicted nucleotidyltransferase
MLKLFNNLAPFFEDNYRRINVREYAKLLHVSPPTASKLLEQYLNEELLIREKDRIYLYYSANKDSPILARLSHIYWLQRLNDLQIHLERTLVDPTIILFGSLSKCEAKQDSDIDLAIISATSKSPDLGAYEKQLKRKIHLIRYDNWESVPKNIFKNIINGVVMSGRL